MCADKAAKDKDRGAAKFFGELASRTSQAAGRASAFSLAAAVVIVWAVTGPLFGFSDTWQLVINTRHHDCDIPHGLPDPEFPEPRQRGYPGQA
jgi:hypothetical protein